MGSSACTTYPYYAAGAGNSWSGGTLYSGKTGDYIYRSKISITTPAFNGPSTKLIVSVTINGTSSPRGCYGVLQSNNNLTTGQVLGDGKDKNGYYDAPHPTVLSGCLGQSHACSNTSGSVVDGYNQSSGYTFYFIFDGVSLSPSTTYTVYVMKYVGWQNSSNGGWDTSSGWTSASSGGIGATIYYNDMYYLDVNGRLDGTDMGSLSNSNGTPYGTCDVYINGSRVANNVGDHYTQYVYGSTYEIKDIKATAGHHYDGVVGGSASGTITGNTGVRLAFGTNYVVPMYKPGGGIVTKSPYYTDSDGFIYNSNTGNPWHHTYYYGNTGDPYNATSFGLIRPGYTFNQWRNENSGEILNQDTLYDSTKYVGVNGVTTANTHNFGSTLIAQWSPNSYTITFDSSGGNSVSSQSVTYSNGAYTLPTPTKTGYKFRRWYADININGPINLGRDYMYTNGIDIYVEAYMADWTQFGDMRLISCTEGGGWNIEPNGGYVQFSMYDAGVGYKTIKSTTKWADLTPGWHLFRMIFSSGYMAGYIDHAYQGQVALSSIGYNATNSIFIGGEATSSNTASSGGQFTGYIGNVSITNSGTNPPTNNFPIPIQNITLYAEWEPCDWMYIKVNNAWKLGRVLYKENGEWQIPSDIPVPDLQYTVETAPGATYGFEWDDSLGYYESKNKGVANSAAVAKVTLNLRKAATVNVECINYAESNYDFGILSNLGTTLATTSTADTSNVKQSFKGLSQAAAQTINYGSLAAGTYTFYVKFRKDSSVNNNNDSLRFKVLFS